MVTPTHPQLSSDDYHWSIKTKSLCWLPTPSEARMGLVASTGLLLFGDEAGFDQWGSLSYTWVIKGQPPVVATSDIRRGYQVFGLLDYFTGQLFYRGHTAKFKAETYCESLGQVLKQIR